MSGTVRLVLTYHWPPAREDALWCQKVFGTVCWVLIACMVRVCDRLIKVLGGTPAGIKDNFLTCDIALN